MEMLCETDAKEGERSPNTTCSRSSRAARPRDLILSFVLSEWQLYLKTGLGPGAGSICLDVDIGLSKLLTVLIAARTLSLTTSPTCKPMRQQPVSTNYSSFFKPFSGLTFNTRPGFLSCRHKRTDSVRFPPITTFDWYSLAFNWFRFF